MGCINVFIAYAVFFAAVVISFAGAGLLDAYHVGLCAGAFVVVMAALVPIAAMQRAAEAEAPAPHPRMMHPSPARLAHLQRVGRLPAVVAPAAPVAGALESALLRVPHAAIRRPVGDVNGVIVASTDDAFVAQVRAAVQSVRGREVLLIAGVAPGDGQGRCRYLWGELWRDGRLHGSEPRRRMELGGLSYSQRHYWIVAQAGEGAN